MLSEVKKLVGFKKALTKNQKDYATLFFSEKREFVVGEATSSINLFKKQAVDSLDGRWVGKDVELVYSVNYSDNTVFLIDVKLKG